MQTTLMLFSPLSGVPYIADSQYLADDFRKGHPKAVWEFNPWTRQRRSPVETDNDPYGLDIYPPGEGRGLGAEGLDVLIRSVQLARNLIDPEMFGHAVTKEVRNAARRALGIASLE